MITTISTLPAVPSRNDPATFSDKADALLGAMPTLVTELNNFVSEVNTLSFKTACRVATTTNITLSGLQTIDGVSLAAGDRVLVRLQTSAAQNGIYTASASTWTRAIDMDTPADVAGSFVPITFGNDFGGKIFYTTFNATGATIGVTAIPWNSLTDSTFNISGPGVLGVANGGTGTSTSTGSGSVVLSNSPTFAGTPTAPTASASTNTTQLATTAFVQAALQALYPVGSIYINATNSTNPGTLLGFGTWVAFGAGRVPVGFNASNPLFDAPEETGGSADAVVVSHTHTGTTGTESANHVHGTGTGGSFLTGSASSGTTGWQGGNNYTPVQPTSTTATQSTTHTHSFTTDSTGSSGTNANYQPYITVYMWKRTV